MQAKDDALFTVRDALVELNAKIDREREERIADGEIAKKRHRQNIAVQVWMIVIGVLSVVSAVLFGILSLPG